MTTGYQEYLSANQTSSLRVLSIYSIMHGVLQEVRSKTGIACRTVGKEASNKTPTGMKKQHTVSPEAVCFFF